MKNSYIYSYTVLHQTNRSLFAKIMEDCVSLNFGLEDSELFVKYELELLLDLLNKAKDGSIQKNRRFAVITKVDDNKNITYIKIYVLGNTKKYLLLNICESNNTELYNNMLEFLEDIISFLPKSIGYPTAQ